MNDKELIERLRYCGADCDMEICGRCPDYEKVNCMEELLIAAASRISDLLAELQDTEKRLAQQRVRAQNAELFVCRLCAECEWEDNGELTVMTMKC